eukprot:CAMPEP_0177650760 /NCGR_PEP_ID=MMETSP0447-20121125/12130_1 /TAXON_ID=0 /ORGANISM="Stygamoeba regulata, Strain BSH-02190019" /LENGTH=126 /DNA_ID=CAMNT_0019153683 /DNA_START=64 /DNA_END=444 /DNA_ORIENTATION=+
MEQMEAISKAFVEHYYNTFDTARQNLTSLYTDQSMLSYETHKIQGQANIMKHLMESAPKVVKHLVTSVDCQPCPGAGGTQGILIMVNGNLQVDQNPLKFCEVFTLMPTQQPGGYWLLNDIFKLNYG